MRIAECSQVLALLVACAACAVPNEPSTPTVAARPHGSAGAPAAAVGGGAVVTSCTVAGTTGSGIAGSGGHVSIDADSGVSDIDAGNDKDASTLKDSRSIPPRGTGPGDWVAGDYPPDIEMQNYLEIDNLPGQAGNARQYKVHVPPSYDPKKPMPVVFCIHGLAQNAVMFCVDGAGLNTKADAANFICRHVLRWCRDSDAR
jgi:hypothetical protein